MKSTPDKSFDILLTYATSESADYPGVTSRGEVHAGSRKPGAGPDDGGARPEGAGGQGQQVGKSMPEVRAGVAAEVRRCAPEGKGGRVEGRKVFAGWLRKLRLSTDYT